MFLTILGRFSIIFDMFDPRILIFTSEDQVYFNKKFWRPVFEPFIALLMFSRITGGSCVVVVHVIHYTQYLENMKFGKYRTYEESRFGLGDSYFG